MKSKYYILLIALIICVLGILSIYSSTYQKEGQAWQVIYKKQIFSIILGVSLFLLMSELNYRRIWDGTYFLYGLTIMLLFLVFLLGLVRLGAQRWLRLGWFNFQPSELAKLAVIIFLARYFSTRSAEDVSLRVSKLGLSRAFILPLIFVIILMGLIIEQPDLGTAMLLAMIFVAMAYMGGVKLRHLFLFLGTSLLLCPLLWHFLRDYQKKRLLVFLDPGIDPLGAGYTVIQSKIAIGSGGFWGKGWLAGTQSQLHFLPEAHTDFIFATFTEEWGFMGAAVLLFLYYLLIRKGIDIALHTSDYFGKALAFGITLMLGVQVFINIAMNLGLAPIVGVPLPLMSYGGSSLVVTFIALGILANIGKTRNIF